MRQVSKDELGEHDDEVEPTPDGEGPVKAGGGVAMTMVVIVVMLIHAALDFRDRIQETGLRGGLARPRAQAPQQAKTSRNPPVPRRVIGGLRPRAAAADMLRA